MNEILIDAFRHKLWAMKTLIAACQDRSVDELTRPAAGFGSILATLNHLVLADAGYVRLRKGTRDGRRTTWVALTNPGRKALRAHVAALRRLIDLVEQ